MNEKDFKNLLQGVRELKAYMKGDTSVVAKVDVIEPGSVAAIRAKLRLSQPEFANLLSVGVGTVRNWEQGRRQPTGATRLLLRLADHHPKIVLNEAREAAAA